jgi:polyketide synthase PksN
LPRLEPTGFTPRHEGIYLITGGMGALGLELAGHMAEKGAVNLALLSSTPLPARDQWQDILSAGAADEQTGFRIERLMQLAEMGVNVECIAADVGDFSRMQEVLQRLRADFGHINGIVHAAGRAGDGFLHGKSRERFDAVLRPKVDGGRVLHELTLKDQLDFFILYSSVAPVLRSPGQSDYTAANTYLDALAHYRRGLGLPAISIGWSAWREVGMAVEYGAVDEEEFFAPIDTADALRLLDRALSDDRRLPPAVIMSEINSRASLEQVNPLGLELSTAIRRQMRRGSKAAGSAAANSGQVMLQGIDAPDEITMTVARIWGRVLGLSELAADDLFADHGGNSILTTQLYRELDRIYPGGIDVADLFTYTTIREQVEVLRKSLGIVQPAAAAARRDETDLDQVLARLAEGSISAQEAELILANAG